MTCGRWAWPTWPSCPPTRRRSNDAAQLTGRNLEPWRAILAVALWLDDHGTAGLFERLDALSVAYQTERTDLEIGDLTALVIRAFVVMKLPTLPTFPTLPTLTQRP